MVANKKTVSKKPARKRTRRKPAKTAKTQSARKKQAKPVSKKQVKAVEKKSRTLLKAFLVFVFGSILGTGFGVAVGIFVYPYIFPPPPANEVVTKDEQKGLFAVGKFIHANPRDPVHFGSGSVTVYKNLVHLGGDFKVGPGPAFHVFLSPREKVRTNSDFSKSASLDLGKLRAFEGSQKYKIPEGTNLSAYKSVVIWCERFNVLISPADLKKVSMAKEKKSN